MVKRRLFNYYYSRRVKNCHEEEEEEEEFCESHTKLNRLTSFIVTGNDQKYILQKKIKRKLSTLHLNDIVTSLYLDFASNFKTYKVMIILGFSINKPFLWVLKLFPCFFEFLLKCSRYLIIFLSLSDLKIGVIG